MNWPNDADGDVLRRMFESGFDFGSKCLIEFNVDFDYWPPSDAAFKVLSEKYGEINVFEPEAEYDGYYQFQIYSKVTYELVLRTQREASSLMQPFSGVCESWGVLQE